jgi:hypothetical protein
MLRSFTAGFLEDLPGHTQRPKDLGSDERSLLLQTASHAMLEHSLIKISGNFTSQHTVIVPPTLQGSEHLLRYLVLEIQSTPRQGYSAGKLHQVTESIGNLKLQFLNLEACIILLHIIHDEDKEASSGSIEEIRSTRSISRVNGAYKVTTLEDSIIGFINTFMERGPGKRKFVRISHQGNSMNPTYTYIGPMVRLGSFPRDVPLTGEPTSIVNAKRIFDTAYQNWIPRNKVYCHQGSSDQVSWLDVDNRVAQSRVTCALTCASNRTSAA